VLLIGSNSLTKVPYSKVLPKRVSDMGHNEGFLKTLKQQRKKISDDRGTPSLKCLYYTNDMS